MRCPWCRQVGDDRVIDSRENVLGSFIRRRRQCLSCGKRFTTIETITNATARASYMADALRFFSKPARFTDFALLPDQHPVLTLTGEPGAVYSVEVSANFTNWAVITNLLNATGTVQFAEGPVTNTTPRFYRAMLAP